MADQTQEPSFRRCKAEMGQRLSQKAIRALQEHFLGCDDNDEDCDYSETTRSQEDFMDKLEERGNISSESIEELLDALDSVGCGEEKDIIKPIFQNWMKCLTSGKGSQEQNGLSTSGDQPPNKRLKIDTEESEEVEEENQFRELCVVKVIKEFKVSPDNGETGFLAGIGETRELKESDQREIHVGQVVLLYLFKRPFKFRQNAFYKIKRCTQFHGKNNLELLISPVTLLSRISESLTRPVEEPIYEEADVQSHKPKRCLPTITIKDAKDCYYGKSCGILSVRGVIFEKNFETDDGRVNFKFTDDGENFVSIVAPSNLELAKDIVHKATVEITYLQTDPGDENTKYLLCTNDTTIKHVTDPKVANLLECELVNMVPRVRGKVQSCDQKDQYHACKYCYQKKLKQTGKGWHSPRNSAHNYTQFSLRTSQIP